MGGTGTERKRGLRTRKDRTTPADPYGSPGLGDPWCPWGLKGHYQQTKNKKGVVMKVSHGVVLLLSGFLLMGSQVPILL